MSCYKEITDTKINKQSKSLYSHAQVAWRQAAGGTVTRTILESWVTGSSKRFFYHHHRYHYSVGSTQFVVTL